MYCHSCGQHNNSENLYCFQCGQLLKKRVLNFYLNKKRHCSVCGQLLAENGLYCFQCGLNLLTSNSEELISSTEGKVEDNLKTGIRLTWEDFKDVVLWKRAFWGATQAIIIALVVMSGIYILLNRLVGEEEIYRLFGDNLSTVGINPLTLLLLIHGVPFFLKNSVGFLQYKLTATLSLQFTVLVFLLIPFGVLFFCGRQNTRHLSLRDWKSRLQISLSQGIIYGLLLTVLGKVLQSYTYLPLNTLAHELELTKVLNFLSSSVIVSGGILFFKTLIFVCLWGCLFSFMGAFYDVTRFRYRELFYRLYPSWQSSIGTAFDIFKYCFFIGLIVTVVYVLFIGLNIINFMGLTAFVLFLLAVINCFPFALLLLQGAPLDVGFSGMKGLFFESISLWSGINTGGEGPYMWLYCLILFIPIVLGYMGGMRVQKKDSSKAIWQNAGKFSLCYTAFFAVLLLLNRVSGAIEVSGLTSLFDEFGIPSKIQLMIGFPFFKSLLNIFVLNYIAALFGAYFSGPRRITNR